MRKGKSSTQTDSAQETHIASEATARGSSPRPRGRVGRFLGKVKENVKLRMSRSRNSIRDHSPVPRTANVSHEHASSTPNLEVQAAPSGAEVEADTQSALQDTQEAAKRINPLSEPAITVDSVVQGAQDDLDADTHIEPLKIFDEVIGKLADVHPYAKMALGVLSWAAKIIVAQADRDKAVLELLKKISEVYSFIMQDDMLNKISSMGAILAQISQQTRECANFIKNYSQTKNFCES
ncbi:hypothetical protein BDR07DRAFT_32913 [Suillus spraguei]|nr:hypothetical protein BDR07DRAFT_32913 [Suillus spraguei]